MIICDPGISKMMHFIRLRNFPYLTEKVERMTEKCNGYAVEKPKFERGGKLIKATPPSKKLNIDFKGPLPSNWRGNKYSLTIIDEYSCFPFSLACKDMLATTELTCLNKLFYIFGMPSYINSDRELSPMLDKLRRLFFQVKGIATSRSTGYNSGKHSHGTLWRTID